MPDRNFANHDPPPIDGLDALWAETLGDERVCVAVLDGSPRLSHSCFAGARLDCVETLVECTARAGPSCDHATAIASLLFAQHGSREPHGQGLRPEVDRPDHAAAERPAGPLRGIAPRCRGLVVPIFRDGAKGAVAPCSQIDLARAIDLALVRGARVINISAGQLTPSGQAHPLLADAVRKCARNGALIVSAVGNDGCECLHIPGALDSVLAVGATDRDGRPSGFSNWGGPYAAQGVLAPGDRILTAACDGGLALRTGTSFATALVSGVAALLLSRQARHGHAVDVDRVRTAILRTATPCDGRLAAADCARHLVGRLSIRGAVDFLQTGVTTMSSGLEQVSTDGAADNSGARVLPSMAPPSAPDLAAVAAAGSVDAVPRDAAVARDGAQLGVGGVQPSACGCGCSKNNPPQLVYALGRLGYDYPSLSRRDSITQHMVQPSDNIEANPDDPAQLLRYLEANPWDAAAITWTLNIEDTPVYAIRPAGSYAEATYVRLREFLRGQTAEGVDRVSIPGYIVGKTRLLMAHMDVPVIVPEIRDMSSWNTAALVTAALGSEPGGKEEKVVYRKKSDAIHDFLDRVYHGFRNLGVLPQDRAVNYAATNAFQVSETFQKAINSGRELDSFEAVPSPMCRPDSDCWDVKLIFFDPAKQLERARRVYRFTVDVSDVVPVLVGEVRTWHVH